MTFHQTLILCPDLCSRLIIKQYTRKALRFCCYANRDYHIELWSNLSIQKEWTAFPFTQQSTDTNEYQLIVTTFHLIPGDYEFTLRFTSCDGNEDWSWYGKPGQNGCVRIAPKFSSPPTAPTFATVPQLRFVAKEHTSVADLWHFKTQLKQGCSFSLGKINHPIQYYVSLIRKGSCWLTPVAGKTNFDHRNTEEKWQLLLYQDEEQGNIHLWMAVGQKIDCWLSPGPNNTIDFHYTPCEERDAHLLISSSTSKNRDFAHLIQTALNYYAHSIKGEGSNGETENNSMVEPDSIMLDKLGYCTWNAFGKSVSAEKLYEAMDSLQSQDIPVAYVILDDGWQEISNEKKQLISMDACEGKFPGRLEKTVSSLKSKYPFVQRIGVWHALWGYWNGIEENFAKEYGPYQMLDNKGSTIGIIKNPKKFYHDFYRFLNAAGVDFVKVDNQGGFQDLILNNSKYEIDLWDEYRQVMIENADEFLGSRVIHSMSLTPHVLFDAILSHKKKSIFRNSDDFFPGEEQSHSWHIYANAINSLWTLQYPAVGDWDMFQSDHPFAEYHASSRAISGGPIYITDIPGKHNTSLIQKLIGETRHNGYTILRSAQAPQPTFETVFGNPMENESIISLYNLHHEKQQNSETWKSKPEYGVCSFWNTGPQEKLGVVTGDLFCSRRLAMTPTVAYVVSGPDQGKLIPLDPSDPGDDHDDIISNNDKTNASTSSSTASSSSNSPIMLTPSSSTNSFSTTSSNSAYRLGGAMSVRVKGLKSSLVSVSHVHSVGMLSVACLGLIDKFNGTKAILQTALNKHQENGYYAKYEAYLTHRSNSCGFWIKSYESSRCCSYGGTCSKPLAPKRVVLDNQELKPNVDWTWCSKTGLLKVDMMAVPLDVSKDDTFYMQIYI